MRKDIEINKISLKLFYEDENDYNNINFILDSMEKENMILSWSIDDNKEYEISYLDNTDRKFILDIIRGINKNLGFKTVTYKEKATLIF